MAAAPSGTRRKWIMWGEMFNGNCFR
jgi:hypothetical protein